MGKRFAAAGTNFMPRKAELSLISATSNRIRESGSGNNDFCFPLAEIKSGGLFKYGSS
ncbi:hypothetical protein [Flaviaesturariibacter terrae]